jgi:hypothetical protein
MRQNGHFVILVQNVHFKCKLREKYSSDALLVWFFALADLEMTLHIGFVAVGAGSDYAHVTYMYTLNKMRFKSKKKGTCRPNFVDLSTDLESAHQVPSRYVKFG